MKKGDLVQRKRWSTKEEFYYIPDFETAVLLSDPYAAVFTKQTEAGEAIYSQEKLVVDVLANDQIIQKCPIDFITRVENVRNKTGIIKKEVK